MGVVLLLTVMRVVSYQVAFGCIHCIRDAYEISEMHTSATHMHTHAFRVVNVCISKLHTAYDCIRPHTMCCISPHTEGRTAYSCIQVGDAYNCIRWSAYMCIHVAFFYVNAGVCVSLLNALKFGWMQRVAYGARCVRCAAYEACCIHVHPCCICLPECGCMRLTPVCVTRCMQTIVECSRMQLDPVCSLAFVSHSCAFRCRLHSHAYAHALH